MGQTVSAPQQHRASSSSTRVLVDMDNIAFYGGQLDGPCLRSRVNAIEAAFPLPAKIEYFCNPSTFAFLELSEFDNIPEVRQSPSNEKDSADHMLLRKYVHLSSQASVRNIVVLSHDTILMRLAAYLQSNGKYLNFATFGKSAFSCDQLELHPKERFGLSFKNREDMDAFMDSLRRFRESMADRNYCDDPSE